MKKVSVCIPLYNEEQVLPELYRRLDASIEDLIGLYDFEVILVDDGSSDETAAQMRKKSLSAPHYKSIFFSRNFGQQSAYSAALDASCGDVVILMDGDLQDPPEMFKEMLAKLENGFDVVYVKRESRKESFLKRVCYRAFYKFIRIISDVPMPENAGDFSAMSRRVADFISNSPECHRYLRGLRAWVGYKQISIQAHRETRAAGKSEYSFVKLCELAANGVFSFSIKPIRVAMLIGAVINHASTYIWRLFDYHTLFDRKLSKRLYDSNKRNRAVFGYSALISRGGR